MAYTTIDDPSEYFHTLLYTGNASDDRNLTNDANAGDFKPDWLWIKERNSTSSHQLIDSNRGTRYAALSDSSNVEDDDQNRVQSFLTDGFQVGTASTVNENNKTYVAWQWKANGGTTSSNTSGSITSTVQANTTAGFSIVTWTGTEGNATVGHGIGKRPECIIVKTRGGDENWVVRFKDTITGNAFHKLHLNKTNAIAVDYTLGNMQDTSSSVFYLQNSGQENDSGQPMVAYCFAPIQGYSKFGSYTGNANADGTFVYTGFKPAWVMTKRTDSSQNWAMYDNKRDGINVIDKLLYPNGNDAEVTTGGSLMVDFLSNGFKWRGNSAISNGSGNHIYLAFAEHPFVSSKGVPTTAR